MLMTWTSSVLITPRVRQLTFIGRSVTKPCKSLADWLTMPKRRDLNLQITREKILAAAREEFAANGMAGARTAAIAHRAGVRKSMLHHCFRSKGHLYQEVVRATLYTDAMEAVPDDLTDTLVYWFDLFGRDPQSLRLFEWEALEVGGKLIAKEQRQQLFKSVLAHMRRWQAEGRIPSSIDVTHLYLSMVGLTIFPRAFPQICKLITGYAPSDSRFRRESIEFLRWLGGRMQGHDSAIEHRRIAGAQQRHRKRPGVKPAVRKDVAISSPVGRG